MSGPKRFLLPLCAAVIPILALLAPASASATFSYGVQASEVTSSGAVLWAHADSSGPVTAEVANSKKFSPLLGTLPGTASASDDNTVQVTWTGLHPLRSTRLKNLARWQKLWFCAAKLPCKPIIRAAP